MKIGLYEKFGSRLLAWLGNSKQRSEFIVLERILKAAAFAHRYRLRFKEPPITERGWEEGALLAVEPQSETSS